MKFDLNRLSSVVLTLAACAIAVALVRREFFPSAASQALSRQQSDELSYERSWKDVAAAGTLVGQANAPIQIVEFSELECPFCRRFHEGALKAARTRFGDTISVSFVHYPIPGHRFARPAARAALCANAHGHFGSFVEAVFAKQDSLGLKSWASYGADAGLVDTVGLTQCAALATPLAQVDSNVALGKRLRVPGTPTVFLNGWRYSAAPSDSVLMDDIARLLRGEQPVKKR